MSSFTKEVTGVTVHNDRIYALVGQAVSGSTYVSVFDLNGKCLQSWHHQDVAYKLAVYCNSLAIVDNNICVPNRAKHNLTIYSLNGELLRTFSCPQIGSTNVALCAVGRNDIIVSDNSFGHVFRMNVSTGMVAWTRHLTNSLGVVCYGENYVLVASKGNSAIHLLDAKTGNFVIRVLCHLYRTS